MKHIQITLSQELYRKFQIACVHEEKEMSEVIPKFIEGFGERTEKKLKSKLPQRADMPTAGATDTS